MAKLALMIALALAAVPRAASAEDREFCADRPGIGTPPCTMAPGEAMIEVGVGDWERARDADTVEHRAAFGDTLLRVGIADSAEIELGLAGYQRDRVRERASGAVERMRGVGDATLAVRRGIAGPNGPVAIEGFVTLPLSHAGDGMGRALGGVLLPAKFALPAEFELEVVPEADLAADEESGGRHLFWGGVIGISHDLVKDVAATLELSAYRDDDPSGHGTDSRVAGSLAWQVGERFQLDVEVDLGLAHGAPDRAVLVGFARRFG